MAFYRRNLPHWHPEGKCIFLTWRLHGSLPAGFLRGIRLNRNVNPREEFRLAENMLDRPAKGPLWLKNPGVADEMAEMLLLGAFALRRFDLHAYSVMSNHIHVLLAPLAQLRVLTQELKGASARRLNAILHRTGRFWQAESFDHWVRNEGQFVRIKNYIENNPVKAGLVAKAEDWPWSSAFK
jgi:putative transposase